MGSKSQFLFPGKGKMIFISKKTILQCNHSNWVFRIRGGFEPLHRENNKPAIIDRNGYKAYYNNGRVNGRVF